MSHAGEGRFAGQRDECEIVVEAVEEAMEVLRLLSEAGCAGALTLSACHPNPEPPAYDGHGARANGSGIE